MSESRVQSSARTAEFCAAALESSSDCVIRFVLSMNTFSLVLTYSEAGCTNAVRIESWTPAGHTNTTAVCGYNLSGEG